MKLIVTYDGSETSKAALEPAAKLARASNGQVTLLRVHRPSLEEAVHPDLAHREAQIRADEAAWQKDLEQVVAGMDCDVRPLIRRLGQRWNVADEIIATATELNADLICMATHGESALRHFVAGSTALDVLSKSPCPLLLVRSVIAPKTGQGRK